MSQKAMMKNHEFAGVDMREFYDAIRAAGLEPPEIIEPGKFHRFPGADKPPSNDAGWCLLFEDGEGGCFGDWSTGLSETWQAKRSKPLTPAERAAYQRKVQEARARRKAELITNQNAAAKRAKAIWDKSIPAPNNHPYLVSKGIQAHGARLYKGLLVLPLIDFTRKLFSLQFISQNGDKKFIKYSRERGCFIHVNGDFSNVTRVVICEGWATGCTLAEDEPKSVVLAALNADNLKTVSLAARMRWQNAEIILAGDDDRLTEGNPGKTKAKEAAIAAKALLAFPEWPEDAPEHLTDFNDLVVWRKGAIHGR